MLKGSQLIVDLIEIKYFSLLKEQLTQEQKNKAKDNLKKFLEDSLNNENVIKAIRSLSGVEEEEIRKIYQINLNSLNNQ